MSVKMTARVWALDDEELKDARLLTLLSLADYANSDDQSWPSIATLVKRTRISERQIQRSIQWLCLHGYIEITEKGNGRGRVTTYQLLIKGDNMTPFSEECAPELTPVDSIKGDIGDVKGDISAQKGDIGDEIYSYVRREPLTEPLKKPGESAQAPAPPANVVSSGRTGARQIKLDSPYLKGSKFVNGYVPPGGARNAVEVYYERFDIRHVDWRLSDPQEEDLIRHCRDLDLLREVVTAYDQSGYKTPRNIKLILDWYREPHRFRNRQNGTSNGHNQANHQQPEAATFTTAQRQAYDAERRAEGIPY
jgi:hypothetical protein